MVVCFNPFPVHLKVFIYEPFAQTPLFHMLPNAYAQNRYFAIHCRLDIVEPTSDLLEYIWS